MSKLQYPKNEKVWVSYYNLKQELLFILTSKGESREFFFLYEHVDGAFKKLGRAKNPEELEEKFHVHERMCAQ